MLCVLWLGSSVGNLKPHEAVGFFKSVLQSAGPKTQVGTLHDAADVAKRFEPPSGCLVCIELRLCHHESLSMSLRS